MDVLSPVRDPLLHQGLKTDENDDLASPGHTHRHGMTFIVMGFSLGRTSLLGRIEGPGSVEGPGHVEGLGGPRNFRREGTIVVDGQ